MGSGKATKIAFKRAGAQAKKTSSAFTAHGSKFAKREEEKHVNQKEAAKSFSERSVVPQVEDKPSPFELAQQAQRGKRGRDYDTGDHMLEGMRNNHQENKKEKFEGVIELSRQEKAAAQRKRDAVVDATDTLDTEFNQVSHLLKQRTRKDIDKYEFENPTNQETAAWWIEQKAKRDSRSFSMSTTKVTSDEAPGATAGGLDVEDQRLLAKIRSQDPSNKAEKAIASKLPFAKPKQADAHDQIIPSQSAADDEFDRMMGSLRGMGATNTLKTARAVPAAPTEEDTAAGQQLQEAVRLAQSAAPAVVMQDATETRKEWVNRGGDSAFDMNDVEGQGVEDYDGVNQGGDDEDEDELQAGPEPDAKIYAELEHIEALIHAAAKEGPHTITESDKYSCSKYNSQIMRHAFTLYGIAQASPTVAISTFRHFLMECEKTSDTTPLALVMFYLLTVIFPTTDFHHPLMTPLRILLSHRLAKIELSSVRQIKLGLYYASLLQSTLAPQERFAAEVLALLYNVYSLPIPQREVRTDAGVPLLNRRDFPTVPAGSSPEMGQAISLITDLTIADGDSTGEEFAQALVSAYDLGCGMFSCLKPSPSFEAMAAPFVKLGERLEQRASRFPLMAHAGGMQKSFYAMVGNATTDASNSRMPLAMRTFRPKPLKQFEPLMQESDEVHTRREMRKEVKEDRKRVVRHLTAEASVHRKTMERDNAAEDKRRTGKYKELMSELQSQQNIMKTVDMHRTKSREKKKSKITGDTGDAKAGKGGGKGK